MIDAILKAVPKIKSQHIQFDVFFMLSDFKDERIVALLNSYREHQEYLIPIMQQEHWVYLQMKWYKNSGEKKPKQGFWKKLLG